MSKHKSIDSLLKEMSNKAKKSLETNIKPLIEKDMQDQIYNVVYEGYTPVPEERGGYVRTYEFLDRKNIVTSKSYGEFDKHGGKVEISSTHISYDDEGRNLSKLIILGQYEALRYGQDIALYDDIYIKKREESLRYYPLEPNQIPFWYPRDFIQSTKDTIKSNRDIYVNALKKGMKK